MPPSSTSGSRRGWSRNSRGSSARNSCIWITARRSEYSIGGTRSSSSRSSGRRPAVGARALSDREIREEANHRDELPEGHQSLLHAIERRRLHRRSNGRMCARDRRGHRRQSARGAARRIGPQHGQARHRPRALRLVPRSAPLRCRTPASASALPSPPSPTSPASRTSATPSLPANARQCAVLKRVPACRSAFTASESDPGRPSIPEPRRPKLQRLPSSPRWAAFRGRCSAAAALSRHTGNPEPWRARLCSHS